MFGHVDKLSGGRKIGNADRRCAALSGIVLLKCKKDGVTTRTLVCCRHLAGSNECIDKDMENATYLMAFAFPVVYVAARILREVTCPSYLDVEGTALQLDSTKHSLCNDTSSPP